MPTVRDRGDGGHKIKKPSYYFVETDCRANCIFAYPFADVLTPTNQSIPTSKVTSCRVRGDLFAALIESAYESPGRDAIFLGRPNFVPTLASTWGGVLGNLIRGVFVTSVSAHSAQCLEYSTILSAIDQFFTASLCLNERIKQGNSHADLIIVLFYRMRTKWANSLGHCIRYCHEEKNKKKSIQEYSRIKRQPASPPTPAPSLHINASLLLRVTSALKV